MSLSLLIKDEYCKLHLHEFTFSIVLPQSDFYELTAFFKKDIILHKTTSTPLTPDPSTLSLINTVANVSIPIDFEDFKDLDPADPIFHVSFQIYSQKCTHAPENIHNLIRLFTELTFLSNGPSLNLTYFPTIGYTLRPAV